MLLKEQFYKRMGMISSSGPLDDMKLETALIE